MCLNPDTDSTMMVPTVAPTNTNANTYVWAPRVIVAFFLTFFNNFYGLSNRFRSIADFNIDDNIRLA